MEEEQTLTLTSEAEREREPEKDEAMSDSDDSDSEDEAQQNIQIESLQTELAANPSNYDAHLRFYFTPMTNKKSTKTPNKLQENTVVEEKKPASAPKKAVNEIDEIFAGKKRKKPDVKKNGKSNEATKSMDRNKKNDKKKPRRLDESEYVERPSRPRKKTDDGLTIYTEEELGISKGNAGSTPLCPFDCSCCF